MAKEVNSLSSNGALLGLKVQAVCSKAAEDFVEEVHMFFEGCRVDHDVINVDVQTFPNTIIEDLIHHTLESGRGIAWSKGHSGKLVLTIQGNERGSFDCFFCHSDLIVSHEQVKHGEILQLRGHVLKNVTNLGNREGIQNCDLVELAVV